MLDKKNILNIYPLTPLQEGMLFRERMSGPGAYIMQSRFAIRGDLDTAIFEQSWNRLVKRHDALRTLIAAEGADRPLQIVLREMSVDIGFSDCSRMDDTEKDRHITDIAAREIEQGFDLKQPPLFRIELFKTAPQTHIFLFTFHHIIMDGWCQGILHEELLSCYTALARGKRPALPATMPFSRYIRYLEEQDDNKGRKFWRDNFADFEPSDTTGWTKRDMKPAGRYEMAVLEFTLPEPSVKRLRELAAECATTLNAAVQTLWGTAIARLSGKRDIAWGTVVSGRPPELAGSERALGLFINTIPVRIGLWKSNTFRTLLAETGRWLAGSMPYQHFPLAEIRRSCGISAPLFDHLMIFENYPVADETDAVKDTLSIAPDGRLSGHTEYDIVFVADSGSDLACFLKYNASIIPEETAALIRDTFLKLTGHMLENPDQPITETPFLPDDAMHDMTKRFAQGEVLPEDTCTFPELFDDCASRNPDQTAVIAADGVMSYRELQHASNALAAALSCDVNIRPGSTVALMTDRNKSMLAGIIGIMKAGAVFVPLDPSYPDERITFILENTGCTAVLSGEKYCHRFTEHTVMVITVEAAMNPGESMTEYPVATPPKPNDTAYIIHTSGSTGEPKGVVVEHRSLSNFIRGYSAIIPGYRDTAMTIAFVANYVFDAAGRAFYPSLCYGHTVAIASEETRLDAELLTRFLSDNAVDILDCTPTLAGIALEAENSAPNLKRFVLGGEALKRATVDSIRERYPNAEITNVYGPTETTIDSSFCHIDSITNDGWDVAPIGRALPNQTVYILDDALSPLPTGAEGEICIGGAGVARGYLNRDDLTEKSFVKDPFNPGQTLYKTGDTGYWRSDGFIRFTGRRDNQVKIRGFRIEPGEIETAVASVPGVRQCAVIVTDGPSDEKRLFAYVAGSPELTAQTVRTGITKTLPAHMIPGVITVINRMPLTPTGKIDRQALKSRASEQRYTEQTEPPGVHMTPSERAVKSAMQSLLDSENIDTGDNFFEAGGHSLLAVRLVSLLAKSTGKRLPVSAVYRHPTAQTLAGFIDRYDPAINSRLSQFNISFNGHGAPLYCFPPYGGSGIVYQRFAGELGDCRRLVCFNYLRDVDFVKEASAQIMSETNGAPATLLGYSGGGNIAFETAREIEKNGGRVAHIIMLDSYRRMEPVEVPVTRHEQEMRAILDSDEYAVFFTDTAAKETAVLNGTAYAEHLYSRCDSGSTHARITVITAEDGHDDPGRDRFGMFRSLSAWKENTCAEFSTVRGHGAHDAMLEAAFSGANASIVRGLLGC